MLTPSPLSACRVLFGALRSHSGAGLLLALALGIASPGLADALTAADETWRGRADGEATELRGRVLEAVRGYEAALEEEPANLQVRWKLLRALHFLGEFAEQDPEEQGRIFTRGRDIAERGLVRLRQELTVEEPLDELPPRQLDRRLAASDVPPSDMACLYFWSAIHTGSWSRGAGLLNLVTEGVASRLYRYASLARRLDATCEEGGALRLLGRLHASLPRVPLVTGWVDRDRSIPLLEEALDLAPEHPGNRLLLGMSLLDLAPARRDEALALLETVAVIEPRPTMRIEDLAIRDQARKRLAEAGQAEAFAR